MRELGERHRFYAVDEPDFDTLGEVLQWTLARSLGARFTPEVRDAWAAVYSVLSGVMTQGLTAYAQAAD